MQLSALTRPYVEQAIRLSKTMGRTAFLSDHGYKPARDYFVLYDAGAYDSKAVAGVAYGLMTGTTCGPNNFQGGRAVANRLRELGFDVIQLMDWQLEETILACDLLFQNGWATITESDPRVSELSRLLRTQWNYAQYLDELRGPGSVHHKLEDLRTANPKHPGATKRGGALTLRVAEAFAADPDKMHAMANELRSTGRLGRSDSDAVDDVEEAEPTSTADFVTAAEGKVVRRLVSVRERNPKLRADKIAQSRATRGTIACEVCSFDFEKTYGKLGEGYVHAHHLVPLHFSGEVESTVDDLVLVCANCHYMIHRARPQWLTPLELRNVIDERLRAQ